jgi:hypothetical protein
MLSFRSRYLTHTESSGGPSALSAGEQLADLGAEGSAVGAELLGRDPQDGSVTAEVVARAAEHATALDGIARRVGGRHTSF